MWGSNVKGGGRAEITWFKISLASVSQDVFPCAVIVAAPSSPTHSHEADSQQGAEPMTGGGAVTGIQTDGSNGPNQRFSLNRINTPLQPPNWVGLQEEQEN